MSLHQPTTRSLALAALAAAVMWAFVAVGGPSAATPGAGLAWLAWQLGAQRRSWLRAFCARERRVWSEASAAAAYFGVVALAGIAAGGSWACGLASVALCGLSIVFEALDVQSPGATWGTAVLAWVGPALPATDRAFSVPATSVDDWLPVLGLTAIYAPLAAVLLWHERRP